MTDKTLEELNAEVRSLRQLLRVQAHKMLVVHKALVSTGMLRSSELDEPQSEATPEVRHITGSSDLVLAFGSKGQGIFSARPELSGTLTKLDVDSIYYRDFLQAWWYKGLLGLTTDIPTTIDYLSDVIKAGEYKRIITTGTSMGAYAAILFGVALNVDRIVAFSPQTKVNIREFKHFGGTDADEVGYDFRSEYADLKTIISKSDFSGVIDIAYGTTSGFDKIHAEHLADFPFVRLHPLDSNDHNAAAILKSEGRLDTFFNF